MKKYSSLSKLIKILEKSKKIIGIVNIWNFLNISKVGMPIYQDFSTFFYLFHDTLKPEVALEFSLQNRKKCTYTSFDLFINAGKIYNHIQIVTKNIYYNL